MNRLRRLRTEQPKTVRALLIWAAAATAELTGMQALAYLLMCVVMWYTVSSLGDAERTIHRV